MEGKISHALVDGKILRDDFMRDGYVVLRGCLDRDAMDELESEVERLIADVVPRLPREHVFYEDRRNPDSLKQLQQLWRHDAYFERLMLDSPLYRLAECLLDGPVVPKNMQYFNKPPGVGQATPPHQDGFYMKLEPCEALTMWLALDRADEQNGCVHYVHGSHLGGMRPHARTETLGFSQGITDFPSESDRAREIGISAEPGDLLAHHALTIHLAGANRSATRARRALGLIYYSNRAHENVAAAQAYQSQLMQSLAQAGKI